jgi:hypothetical protein
MSTTSPSAGPEDSVGGRAVHRHASFLAQVEGLTHRRSGLSELTIRALVRGDANAGGKLVGHLESPFVADLYDLVR